ncbi:adenylosuccinate lyase [Pseudodesulfovibrio sp. F-1]|uniref:Adenylosuccinate lyase n=1 Tax=Pseudodesulfovibrio alkaliphilus TaxID=2661613 RepID=A0A7K1KPB1_9BACT|nr:adenylosuccinate lyase [Pseudodesulfovibrio alkaliphilus]MUM77935.1 adenylosuccinate lyase [Pseudodesulfovibrio alkaliphilus]
MLERYSRPAMRELWTLENKFRVWLEVELAVTRAWAEMGKVPMDACDEIHAKADFNLDRILEIEETTKHDVIAFLTAVEEKVGPNSRYIHLGCTSSDIVDTANGVLLTRAGAIIAEGIDAILDVLKDMAHRHKGLLCMGRTHGIHAEPTTYGLKFAGFYAEFARHRERFQAAREAVRVGKLSGAVGTFAHLSPELEERTCALLGLKADPHSTQIVQRDRYAQFFTALAMLAGGIERLGLELRHLQRTEVLEVEEGFSAGQKGSSAMPHKKNPISAENLCGLARLIRSNSLAAMENQALWHERDISHSSVERVIMPDTTALIDYMLHRMCGVLGRLVVKEDNIRRNLEGSFGLFYSQRVLNALIVFFFKRQEAYEMVQKVAMRCWAERIQFEEDIRRDAAVTSRLAANVLDEAFDPSYYKRYENDIFARVFKG